MSRSAVLEKSTLGLDDLDAFVDESIDAMDDEQFLHYQSDVLNITRDLGPRVSDSVAVVPEKVR